MLFDDLKEELKNLTPDIEAITAFFKNANIEEEYRRLSALSSQEDFWQHPDQKEILQSLQRLRTLYDRYQELIATHNELQELVTLFEHDENELKKLADDIKQHAHEIGTFKIHLLLNDPQDSANCFLTLNAGAGGTESQDWSAMLLRMYLRFCEDNNLSARVLDYQQGEQAGIKSATLLIRGRNAYGLIKSEHGIHRLVRISPFDANKRRHTSFTSVHVTPEVPDVVITIDPNDLRIDTYKAGGAGGQHVNKTESAVRITHLPTGIVVQCQNERSQHQNKEVAMKMLMAKLAQKQKEERLAQASAVEKKKIEWGSQIRSYVLHPYKMVKDHRTGTESPQPDLVLNGHLMPFIESYLIWLAR